MELTVAICDDEIIALEEEYNMIHKAFEDRNITHTIKKFNNPLDLLNSDIKYEILFLDIEMSGMSGTKLAHKVLETNKDCLMFFITNYQMYLDNALDANAFRFLPKPLEKGRLERGIDSAITKIKNRNITIPVTNLKNKIVVEIPISSILYIENCTRHANIVLTKYEFTAKESFATLKNKIQSKVDYFIESSQSIFLNLSYVEDYDKSSVLLSYGGKECGLYMSRRKFKNFDAKMFERACNL